MSEKTNVIVNYYNHPGSTYFGKKCNEKHFVNKKLHREDGPAYTTWYGNGDIAFESYYINGILHRSDGPAHTQYNPNSIVVNQRYWFNGEQITVNSLEEFKRFVKLLMFK